jgi:8-oxo-dGTP pyrophosphatase MutT (NUDIX family)
MSERPDRIAAVRAAGIVVFRRAGTDVELLLLRNARHGTWGFPKGRAEPDEDVETTARREVREETGFDALRLEPGFAMAIGYPVNGADPPRRKEVHYFLADAGAGVARRSAEHDAMEWLRPAAAAQRLPHRDLVAVLDAALAHLGARR